MAAQDEIPQGTKRPHEHEEPGAESDSDDDIGPSLPSAKDAQQPKRKRRKLPFEKEYIAALPAGKRYSKSLMHKDLVTFVTFTPHTDFLITASIDGYVKFWKKVFGGVEFVKEFQAHSGEIVSVTVSADGRSYATAGADGTVKIFDVETFDLLSMLDFTDNDSGGADGTSQGNGQLRMPRCVCFVHGKGSSYALLAVSSALDGSIHILDGRGESKIPVHVLKMHKRPVHLMAYDAAYDCVVSADEGGMLEYWQPSGNYQKPNHVFGAKSTTDLFEFKKNKSVPCCICVSPSGHQFATVSFPDRRVRIFDFRTGKLYRTYDESIETLTTMHQAGSLTAEKDQPMEAVEFGRRIAKERKLDDVSRTVNLTFDESGHFLLYGSLVGVKVINTLTNRVVRVFGSTENFRPLNLALYQGQPQKKGVVTMEMAAADNPILRNAEQHDAMLVTTGAEKVRFYMFTNEDQISTSDRDIRNEKARLLGDKQSTKGAPDPTRAASATIHTTKGDIQVRLFGAQAPKAVENFTVHARENYYNNIIFHRVIRKFMIQTGDPLGDGTGGESIWGKEFEDEFHADLAHDKPYTVSMANAGPNTNASQFFITTEKCPWLDGKHTVFGRVVKGMDVVHAIENAKVWKEKPIDDIKIVSISLD